MLKKLDEILLSDDVVKNFHDNYKNENFKNWLLNILPEVEECKNLMQDNPWHIYNCLDHILHSVEEINKQSKNFDEKTRRMLAYTMFLHDIGKPNCLIRRYSKLYKREVDSFFNHNVVGAEIAGRVLPQFNFSSQQQEIIKLLIKEHDIFMFITLEDDGNRYHTTLTPNLINEHIEKYNKIDNGKYIMKLLLMVGKADNKAQNPKMTKDALSLLDVMTDMLNDICQNTKA
jgi:UTP:GlnB (protein PII) uridylyltransferase